MALLVNKFYLLNVLIERNLLPSNIVSLNAAYVKISLFNFNCEFQDKLWSNEADWCHFILKNSKLTSKILH